MAASIASRTSINIGYEPDYESYLQRATRRAAKGDLARDLPDGFPKQLEGPLVWDGRNPPKQSQWIFQFNAKHLTEVQSALQHFRTLRLPLGFLSADTFPLPTLHNELRRLSREMHEGHGFFLLRGLPVDQYDREELIIIYAGISVHIAPLRARQDISFDGKPAPVVLSHIRDLRSQSDSSIGSPAFTTDKQMFHTDLGDIVSLFCLSPAAAGGSSQLASVGRVYNELALTRPDIIHTLTSDWYTIRYGVANQGYVSRPIMWHQPRTTVNPDRVLLQFTRRLFLGYNDLQRPEGMPPLTDAQTEALDAIHFLAERFKLSMTFEKGDMQFVNNFAVYHARESFTDKPGSERHLMRLWLRDPEHAWETPAQLQSMWKECYDGVEAESQIFPLEPFVRTLVKGSR